MWPRRGGTSVFAPSPTRPSRRRRLSEPLRGVYLERLTWTEAEPLLRADPLVVIPVGAGAKEHGPHLPLGTDRIMADYLARRLAERVPVVVMPTVVYGYFPHFSPFPGSTHLEASTFQAMMTELVLSLHRHGPRRFLFLNTGVSTYPVLEIVARDLDRVHRLLVAVTRIGDLGAQRTTGLPQHAPQRFANERLRDRVHDLDAPRHLVGRQPLPQPVAHLPACRDRVAA